MSSVAYRLQQKTTASSRDALHFDAPPASCSPAAENALGSEFREKKLPPGPAIAVITIASLFCWAAIIALGVLVVRII